MIDRMAEMKSSNEVQQYYETETPVNGEISCVNKLTSNLQDSYENEKLDSIADGAERTSANPLHHPLNNSDDITPVVLDGPRMEQIKHKRLLDSLPSTYLQCLSRNICQKGLLIIFNQETFMDGDTLDPCLTRHGTRYDRDKLSDVFQQDLKFNVKIYDDLTKDQVLDVIEKAKSSQILRNIDCFVCAVLTHGENNPETGKEDLLFHDSKRLALEDLSETLTAENCPCLAGKPKVFIIQACRGGKVDEVKLDAMAFQDEENQGLYRTECDSIPLSNHDGVIIPSYSDFVYAYSTYPGYAAVRGWYIQSLVYCIKKHHKDRSLLQILTMTNGMVSKQVGKVNKVQMAQTAMFTSTLTKPLFLSPIKVNQTRPDSDTNNTQDPMAEVIKLLKKIPKDDRFGAMAEIMANLKDLP